jgi:hypothetical protein
VLFGLFVPDVPHAVTEHDWPAKEHIGLGPQHSFCVHVPVPQTVAFETSLRVPLLQVKEEHCRFGPQHCVCEHVSLVQTVEASTSRCVPVTQFNELHDAFTRQHSPVAHVLAVHAPVLITCSPARQAAGHTPFAAQHSPFIHTSAAHVSPAATAV